MDDVIIVYIADPTEYVIYISDPSDQVVTLTNS